MDINKINQALKLIGKRIKVEKFRGYAEYSKNIEFYQLSNGKMIIVFWENDIIKSILQQNDKFKKYKYQINGQAGTNTTCIYYAEFDYQNNKYTDILATA